MCVLSGVLSGCVWDVFGHCVCLNVLFILKGVEGCVTSKCVCVCVGVHSTVGLRSADNEICHTHTDFVQCADL